MKWHTMEMPRERPVNWWVWQCRRRRYPGMTRPSCYFPPVLGPFQTAQEATNAIATCTRESAARWREQLVFRWREMRSLIRNRSVGSWLRLLLHARLDLVAWELGYGWRESQAMWWLHVWNRANRSGVEHG